MSQYLQRHESSMKEKIPRSETSQIYFDMILPTDRDDFIKGTISDTLTEKEQIFCTQSPSTKAIPEFLAVVWERKIKTIVVLNQSPKEGLTRYWPGDSDDGYEHSFISWPPFVVTNRKSIRAAKKSRPWASHKIELSLRGETICTPQKIIKM